MPSKNTETVSARLPIGYRAIVRMKAFESGKTINKYMKDLIDTGGFAGGVMDLYRRGYDESAIMDEIRNIIEKEKGHAE